MGEIMSINQQLTAELKNLVGFAADQPTTVVLQGADQLEMEIDFIAVDSMSFHSPVNIGNLVTVVAVVSWVGRTSIETRMVVTAEDLMTGVSTHTNTAYYLYVALNTQGGTAEVPPLICETEEEKALFEEGSARQKRRLERRERERSIDR